jgi:hypothetical protein
MHVEVWKFYIKYEHYLQNHWAVKVFQCDQAIGKIGIMCKTILMEKLCLQFLNFFKQRQM